MHALLPVLPTHFDLSFPTNLPVIRNQNGVEITLIPAFFFFFLIFVYYSGRFVGKERSK